MSVQSDIITALAAVAGGRVYPEMAPDSALPFVVYRKVGSEPVNTLLGYAGLTRFVFAFDCWADTYSEALTLADEVRTAVEAAPALQPQTRESSDADEYEPMVDQYAETVIYTIWHS